MDQTALTDSTFHQLLEAAPDAIVISNNNGVIILANRMTATLFGYQQEELIGKPVEVLIPKRFRAAHPKHRSVYYEQSLTRPMGTDLELWAARKDGSEFPVEVALSPLHLSGTLLVTSVIRDITHRHKMQVALKEKARALAVSNSELEQFAYLASHDLQEPLRMVVSFAQLLSRRNKGKLDKDSEEFIGFLVDGAMRMQELINDLLSYSRIGTHYREFVITSSEDVLKQTLQSLGMTIEENHACISFDPLPDVVADEIQLGQVFQNLICNAIKFRGDKAPDIHISAKTQGSEVIFTVRDKGIGVNKEYQERIFEVFRRLHTKEQYKGTGIGLAICKKITERHGGRIWVESEPGKGASFYFTFKK